MNVRTRLLQALVRPAAQIVHRAAIRRLATLGVVSLALVVLSGSLGSARPGVQLLRQSSPRPPQVQAAGTDTVVVFPVEQFVKTGSPTSWTIFEGEFDADTVAGRRYLVQLDNGTAAGTKRVSNVLVEINNRQFVGSSECGTTTPSLTRIAEAEPGTNLLSVWIKGATDSYIHFRIVRVSDPTFTVFGPKRYTKPGSLVHQLDTFPLATGSSPYQLRFYNGGPSGTNRVSNATISLNGSQVVSSGDLGSGVATVTKTVTLADTNAIDLFNQSGSGTYLDSLRFRATDTTAPELLWQSPADSLVTAASQLAVAVQVSDETPGLLRINGGAAQAFAGLATTNIAGTVALPADGRYTITLSATNSAWLTTTSTRTVWRDSMPPTLTVSSPAGDSAVTDSIITLRGSWLDTTRTTITIEDEVVASGFSAGFTKADYPLDFGPNRIVVRAIDAAGLRSEVTRIVLRKLASDPPGAAPSPGALSATETTPFLPSVQFLYAGAGAVQVGSSFRPESLKADRAAVLRGRVMARDFGPIPGVRVQVLGHPEYGHTLTRADGAFDLVVNGGGRLSLRFSKLGYLEAQRQVDPAVNRYLTLDDVALIGRSARVTAVDLESTQVVRSRFATDANGDRELKLYFPGGLRAVIQNPTPPPDTLFRYVNVRATEYTQGPDGPEAMPGTLPPSTAYTYCVELSLDEAEHLANQSGQPSSVRFTDTLFCYVRNFLGYPVGTRVPYGTFDRTLGQWVAEEDALVLGIVGAAGDTALIDVNGDAVADSGAVLDSLGLTGAERRVLLAEYGLGQSLWRMRLTHFSPGDMNPNAGPPPDPLPGGPRSIFQLLALLFGPCLSNGSILECENRVLGERLPVTGTPYTLNYRSFRAPADSAVRTVHVPLIGDIIPASLRRIHVRLEVAGKVYRQTIPREALTPGHLVSITWDGRDVYDRRIEGSVPAQVDVGYDYNVTARGGAGGSGAFGNAARSSTAGLPILDERDVPRIAWTRRSIVLGVPGTAADGLGGWTLSPHHVFDPNGRGALYYGSGEVDPGDRLPMTRWSFAPVATSDPNCQTPTVIDGLPPDSVRVTALALGPDGTLYFADCANGSVYRVGRDRIAHRVAGTGVRGNFTESDIGGPATSAELSGIEDIAVAPDGTLYLISALTVGSGVDVVCKVTPDGNLHKVLSASYATGSGDDGPASAATVPRVTALAVGPDGALFLAERNAIGDNYARVRRIGTNGVITTYAGSTGCQQSSDSTGLATRVCLGDIADLAVDPGGTLYIVEETSHRVRRVTPEGLISTAASVQNEHFRPRAMAFAPDGSIYLAAGSDSENGAALAAMGVYRLDPDGTLALVGGGRTVGLGYDGAPVTMVRLRNPAEIAVLPDGSYYLASEFGLYWVGHRYATDLGDEWSVPNADGSEVYYFTKGGRHLRTRDALTGTLRHWFGYDDDGRLTAIHDADGGTTTISRSAGVATSITAPDGQVTTLTDSSGWLTRMSDPEDHATRMSYEREGLLRHLTNARGYTSTFDWDDDGRLLEDTDAAGGHQELRTDSLQSRLRRVWRETALGRRTTYRTVPRDDGTMLRQVIGPDGLVVNAELLRDTLAMTRLPDGTVVVDSISGDPRFGIVAPIPAGRTVRLPSGTAQVVQVSRPYSALTFDPPAVASGPWVEQVVRNGTDTVRTEFDLASRRLTVQRSAERRTTVTVDSAGRPLAIHVPGLDTLRRAYDSRGRLTEIRQGSRTWELSYDASGRLEELRDPMDRTTTFAYDAADRETLRVLPGGRRVTFRYDELGNLKRLIPPGASPHEFDYTPVDLTSRYRPPGAGMSDSLTQYGFNLDRQLETLERPDGLDVTLAYNGTSGRLEEISTARGEAAFDYDGVGRLTSLGSPDSVALTYGYDGPLPTSESWSGPVTGSVTVTLDNAFRVASQQVGSSPTVSYLYQDPDGLPTQAGALGMTRDPGHGLLTGTTLGDITTSAGYDAYGEVEHAVARAGGDTLWRAVYGRDALGRIVSIAERVQGTTTLREYAYSDSGFLTLETKNGVEVGRYGYDGNGNRVRLEDSTGLVTASYDAQDRLTAYGATSYTYSAGGDLESRISGADTTRCTYDAFGNLVEVRRASGDTIRYLMDGRNRRVARLVNGVVAQRWLYQDQLEPVAEVDSAGGVLARYVYGTRAHVPDYVVKGDTTYRIIADHLGSVRLVVRVADGVVVQRMEYDAWGNVLEDTSPGFQCFGYAGGLWDAATGLVRFGARDYDPSVGRWTARDPVRFGGGDGNLYAYCGNDPLSYIDASGTDFSVADFAGGAATGFYCAALGTGVLLAVIAALPAEAGAAVLAASAAIGTVGFAAATGSVLAGSFDSEANSDERDRALGQLIGGLAFGHTLPRTSFFQTSRLFGKQGALFGKSGKGTSGGTLNRSSRFRVGWGWKASKSGEGRLVFRVVVGQRGDPLPYLRHLDF